MLYAYTRVSTEEQAADGRTSLATQERIVGAIATLRGETIAAIFSDLISGSVPLLERPGGMAMTAQVRSGDIIVAAKLDRLFRSAQDALVSVDVLKRRGIGVIFADMGNDPVTENGISRLFFGILASVAEFERWRIAERMQEGRTGKRARGGHVGGHPPFGYDKIGDGKNAMLVPNPVEQATIECARTLRESGMTYRAIADRLGLVSRAGTKLSPATVRSMVG